MSIPSAIMRVEITKATIKFSWPSQRARSKVGSAQMRFVPGMDKEQLEKVADAMISLCNGMSISFIKFFMHSLAEIFRKLTKSLGKWPVREEWPLAIYNIYAAQILEGKGSRSVESSRTRWSGVKRVFESLMLKGLVPAMNLPGKAGTNSKKRSDPSAAEVLGESYVPVSPVGISDVTIPKSYLCDLNYSKNDEDFFGAMQALLQSASDTVFQVSRAYWDEMLRCHEAGEILRRSVSRSDLLIAMEDPQWQDGSHSWKNHIAFPGTREGLAYFLGAIEYHFFETGQFTRLGLSEARELPFLRSLMGNSRTPILFYEGLRKELGAKDDATNTLCRALGVLTTRDCAAATSILIHEQPRFNPESIERADAYDSNGKTLISIVSEALWFESVGAHTKLIEFTIPKERAKARKGGLLSPIASEIFFDVERLTSRLREKAKCDQPDIARKLFLVGSQHGFGHVGRVGTYFNSRHKPSVLAKMSKELEQAGFDSHNFQLSKVRNTQGILVWLRTGSLAAMAASMGNSIQVVLENYIPDWVYRRMLIRVARRFQQKLIVLATTGSPWQLSVSDFYDQKGLKDLVLELLSTGHPGSPLAKAFHKAYASSDDSSLGAVPEGEAYISISPESVAALEVFVRAGSSAGYLGNDDLATKLYDLYDLIYAAVQSVELDDVDSAIADLISGGSRAQLKAIWKKSREYVSVFEAKVKNPMIRDS